MSLLTVVLLGIGLLLFGLLVLFISLRLLVTDDVSTRLKTYVIEETVASRRVPDMSIAQRREISGSFMSRAVLPLFKSLGYLLGRLTPVAMEESVRHQLVLAGNPLNLGSREFFGLRIAFLLVGLFLSWIMLSRGFNQNNILVSLMVLLISYLFPVFWLRSMVRSRQEKIRRGLPDALDMLSVCADAGLGFDQSLLRVSEYWKTPIGIEFGRVVAEMEMGMSRRSALRNMSDRLEVSELSGFVSIIIQSEQLGMSIADTLHAQAEQMRIERRFRAQELARTIPIKMLVPLAFLIFPAILAVLLGPAIPQIMELFESL